MCSIRFSHFYNKFRPIDLETKTYLVQIFIVDRKELSEDFIDYDTLIDDTGDYYKLPAGKLMVLILLTSNRLWTTIRRWTPWKEKYYRSLIGKEVEIEIKEL